MNRKTKKGVAVFGEVLGLGISLLVGVYLVPILPFVTEDYFLWLPVGVAATVISAVFDITKHLVHRRYYSGLKVLSLIVEIYSVSKLVQIFPFDFSLIGYGWLNSLMKFALSISVFGMAIAFVVHIIKFVSFSEKEEGAEFAESPLNNTS